MTKHIRQACMDDCGVACLAMLLDMPYDKLRAYCRSYFHYKGYRYIPGLSAVDEMIIAKKLGADLRFINVKEHNRTQTIKELLGRKAILGVPGMNKEYPEAMHSVYWDGDKLYDPTPGRGYASDGAYAFSVMFCAEVLKEEDNGTVIEYI